jgi:hypothetical protein
MLPFPLQTELDLILKYPIEVMGFGFMSFGFLQTFFLVSGWIERQYKNDDAAKFRIIILMLLLIFLWGLASDKIFEKYVI